MSPCSIACGKVWEGFGFAKEQPAPVGTVVLEQGADTAQLESQPGSRSVWQQWLLADGGAVPAQMC